MVAMAQSGRLRPFDLVWNQALGDRWVEAGTIPAFRPASLLPPGATASPAPAGPVGPVPPGAEITRRARAALSGRWGLCIGTIVVFYLVVLGIAIPASIIPLGTLALQFLVIPPITVGMLRFFLAVARQEPGASLGMMFSGFRVFGPSVGANLLVMLFVWLWMLLIIVPFALIVVGIGLAGGLAGPEGPTQASQAGMIAAGVIGYVTMLIFAVIIGLRYSQTFYLVADRANIGPLEAVRASVAMMKGHKGRLFCLALRFIGWSLLAVLTCGIGYLWVIPYMAVAMSVFYDDLARRS